MDFETEEQQLEAIKKWWNDNAAVIVGGIAVGISAIFGWQYYQGESIAHSEKASVIYEQILSAQASPDATGESANEQMTRVNTLVAEYADTPYASLSALLLAKQQMAAGEYIKAQQQLDWVVNNARQDELKYLAKIRLARLYMTSQQADQALALLSQSFPESFQAMALELKGDVLVSQGKSEQARAAYSQALILTGGVNRWLQLKIDDLGEPAINSSINLSTAESTEPSA